MSVTAKPIERQVPHSIEAEEYLIAAVLLDETGQAWAITQHVGVKPPAFYSPAARRVWEAIEAVRSRGAHCDLAALGVEMQSNKTLEEVGGWAYLTQVSQKAPTSAQVRPMAETVKLLWEMRHAITRGAKFVEGVYANVEGRDGFVKLASELGQQLIRLGHRVASKSLAETYDDVKGEAKARVDGTVDTGRWVYTGLPRFDDEARPVNSRRVDGFLILAGGSGDGKTTFMCQYAAANLELRKAVLFISREVDTAGCIEKIVSAKLSVDLNQLESLPKPDLARFEAECDRQRDLWAGKYLWCIQQEDATPIYTVEDVEDRIDTHVQLHGVPAVIFVDYLQIFDARKKLGGGNREAVVAYVSHRLQAMQARLGCAVVVGCQLNEKGLSEMREVKKKEDGSPNFRLPNRGDLRESQAAYHDGHRVWFLFRPPVDATGNDQHAPGLTSPEIWLFQEKRKAGGRCIVKMRFEQRFCRFVELGNKQPVASTGVNFGALLKPTNKPIAKGEFLKGKS